MTYLDSTKKPAHQDWHRADIKAALEKRGFTLAKLSRLYKKNRGAAHDALRKPWPSMEKLIASAIGVPAPKIWPTRYHADGTPKSGRGQRGFGRGGKQYISRTTARNVQRKRPS